MAFRPVASGLSRTNRRAVLPGRGGPRGDTPGFNYNPPNSDPCPRRPGRRAARVRRPRAGSAAPKPARPGRLRCGIVQVRSARCARRSRRSAPSNRIRPGSILILHRGPKVSAADVRSAVKALEKDGLVEFVTPVLRDRQSDARQVLTGEITVRLKPGAAARQTLASLKAEHGVEVKRRNEFEPTQYVVSVPDPVRHPDARNRAFARQPERRRVCRPELHHRHQETLTSPEWTMPHYYAKSGTRIELDEAPDDIGVRFADADGPESARLASRTMMMDAAPRRRRAGRAAVRPLHAGARHGRGRRAGVRGRQRDARADGDARRADHAGVLRAPVRAQDRRDRANPRQVQAGAAAGARRKLLAVARAGRRPGERVRPARARS